MVRFSFVVGAGKLARQKYDDALVKWFSQAMINVAGYEQDNGAVASFECAGSFKFQHDTGKDVCFSKRDRVVVLNILMIVLVLYGLCVYYFSFISNVNKEYNKN